MFSGSIVALTTPFANNSIDVPALARLIRFHLDNGTNAIVPVGTTGEASTLSSKEATHVIDIVVNEVGGQVPVIVGAGSNNTAEAVLKTTQATSLGASAVLHVMGYYNRPGQEGIFQHFSTLNESTELPVLVYNVPPRTVIDILPETLARVAQLPSIVGVKDATADLTRPLKERALINKDFCFLSGEDQTAVAYNANGGQGCISVTANVAPKLCAQLQAACAAQDYSSALKIQLNLMPLHEALFKEPSPAAVKYAASILGLCKSDCRLPIVTLSSSSKQLIEQAMRGIGLI